MAAPSAVAPTALPSPPRDIRPRMTTSAARAPNFVPNRINHGVPGRRVARRHQRRPRDSPLPVVSASCVRPVDDDELLAGRITFAGMKVVRGRADPPPAASPARVFRPRHISSAPALTAGSVVQPPRNSGNAYSPGNRVHPRVQSRHTSRRPNRPARGSPELRQQVSALDPFDNHPRPPRRPPKLGRRTGTRTPPAVAALAAATSNSSCADCSGFRSSRRTFPSPQANISASRPSATFSSFAFACHLGGGIIFLDQS